MNQRQFSISPVSECSILLRFSSAISVELVGEIAQQIATKLDDMVMNVVPSYKTILIDYLPFRIQELAIINELYNIIRLFDAQTAEYTPAHSLSIPVYYAKETALDLERYVSQGISLDALIEAHTKSVYTVSAIGFAPGFAFLSDVVEPLRMPRHQTPRKCVPAGSVAIADSKTAVYPSESPGGWNIIGRTPLTLFSEEAPFIPFEVGDNVTFNSITRQEYIELGGKL